MRTWLVGFSVLIFNSACDHGHSQRSAVDKGKIEKERQNLKNAAFCSCLYKSFPLKDSVFINDGSAAGYLELGSYSIEAYTKVTEVGADYAKIKYNSKYNKDLSVMKCLDFYNSKELDDLVKSFDSQLDTDELSDKH